MCSRFSLNLDTAAPVVRDAMELLAEREVFPSVGDVFPGSVALVFANNRRLKIGPFGMSWGYRKSDGGRIINARSETAEEKTLFSEGVRLHRCVIPASRYYEWQTAEDGKKTKYAIGLAGEPLFYLAGIYRMERELPEFTVLTKEAEPSIAFIHSRMPVILSASDAEDWLNLGSDWRTVMEGLGKQEPSYSVCR